MEDELEILIRQTEQSIEHDKGISAMFATSAEEKQRLLSALNTVKNQLNSKEQECREEHAARIRAEEALAIERQRPLQTIIALPKPDEEESMYPRKNKYVDVVEWLVQQRQKGVDFYAANGYNRSKMCRRLTEIFGWEVNENSLRKAQEEAEKHKNFTN